MSHSAEPFRAFLEKQRPVLVRDLAQALAAQIDGSQNLSKAELLKLAETSIGFFLDQLDSARDELKQALLQEHDSIVQALRESEERYRTLVECAPEGIFIQRGGKVIYANPAAVEMLGARNPAELLGKNVFDIVHPDFHEMVKQRIREANQTQHVAEMIDEKYVRLDGQSIDVEVRGVPVVYEGVPAIQVLFRDIGERKRAEEALRKSALQEEMIRNQEAHLRALSTPLIPLTDKVVLMPLIGDIDARRASHILETLLAGVVTHSAAMVILDMTGVPTVDAQAAEGLRRLTHAVKLLGADVVLTGIQPAMARAFVELGADLTGIVTHGTLRSGIAYALGQDRPRR